MSTYTILNNVRDKGVNNISSVEIPPDISDILTAGLKYALPPPVHASLELYGKEIDSFVNALGVKTHFMLQNMESTGEIEAPRPFQPDPFYVKSGWTAPLNQLIHLDSERKNVLTELKSVLHSDLAQTLAQKVRIPSVFQLKRIRDVRAFAKRPDIVIQNADKGLGLTIMDKTWYLKQGDKVLNCSGYAKLTVEEATREISREWKILLKCHRPKNITKFITQITPANHTIPVLYLMPKLHKNPHGVRPIVAGHSFCFTAAAKVIDHKLRHVFAESKIILRDSMSLVNVLENTIINDPSVIFASADISNLYGEIPLDELFKLCVSLVEIEEKQWMTALLRHVLFCNIVQFNNNLFKQVTGVAMGSPFGPTAANIFLHFLVDKHLIDKSEFPEILFVARYLDDVLFILNGSTDRNLFQTKLNNIHPAMKFTLEASKMSTDFLDLTIYKGERFKSKRIVDLKTFCKPMNKFLYIPYKSLHTLKTLKGFIMTEFARLLRNSSSELVFLNSALEFIQHLRARGYPGKFIRDTWSNFDFANRIDKLTSKLNAGNANDEYAPLIYVSHLDKHTRTGLWRDIVKARLREVVKNAKSKSVTALLTKSSKFIMALKKSPTLYNILVFNRPLIT